MNIFHARIYINYETSDESIWVIDDIRVDFLDNPSNIYFALHFFIDGHTAPLR